MRRKAYHEGAADATRHLSKIVLGLVREILLEGPEEIDYDNLVALYHGLSEQIDQDEPKFGDGACILMCALCESLIFEVGTAAKTRARSHIGEIKMGHKIKVDGPAIITIDAILIGVTQTVNAAPGLDAGQKSQLESWVESLRSELKKLEKAHGDESSAIAGALQSAVVHASKPKAERKHSLLQLSADGLKKAAELVKDVAPTVLATADLISNFIAGLPCS